MNYFEELNKVNVNEHTENKNGLTYLAWAWAWGELKKRYPNSYYTIYENANGWNYHTDGKTCWVKTGVTVIDDENENKIEHIEYLPVMDFKNRSIPADGVTSFDVNKAIQRSLTKACARHGLGLYIYAGEDLPESDYDYDKPVPPLPPQSDTPASITKREPEQLSAKDHVDIFCRVHKIKQDLFGDIFASLKESGQFPNKTTAQLDADEWVRLKQLMAEALKAMKK